MGYEIRHYNEANDYQPAMRNLQVRTQHVSYIELENFVDGVVMYSYLAWRRAQADPTGGVQIPMFPIDLEALQTFFRDFGPPMMLRDLSQRQRQEVMRAHQCGRTLPPSFEFLRRRHWQRNIELRGDLLLSITLLHSFGIHRRLYVGGVLIPGDDPIDTAQLCADLDAFEYPQQPFGAVDAGVPLFNHRIENEEADNRSKALLTDYLTQSQRRELEILQQFTLTAVNGMRYIITNKYHSNVWLLEGDTAVANYCIVVPNVPIYDQMLGIKLLLETDIEAFERIANMRLVGDTADCWLPPPPRMQEAG